MEGEKFLNKKFSNLHTSPEVVSAVKRKEIRDEERVSEKPVDRIENYLNRFSEILNRQNPEDRKRGVAAFKKIILKDNIISKENIPERVYELEQEIAFNLGHGKIEITDKFKQEKNKEIIAGQKKSLSNWVDYLSSEDAMYPMWSKYWVMTSILKVGKYNKEKKSFEKRGKNSVAPFPPLNTGAVAKAIAVIQEKLRGGVIDNFSNLNDDDFKKILDKEDFAKTYALALESLPEFSEKGLENIKGEWIIYKQAPYQRYEAGEISADSQYPSQVQKLFDSLQGYPLEWCTAQNINTAHNQLKGGDFHVYYSEDAIGENKIPRVAIRMKRNEIAEVRGIDANQGMDRYIMPVVQEKMRDFGKEGEKYQKKAEDMRRLMEIYNKFYGEIIEKHYIGYNDINAKVTLGDNLKIKDESTYDLLQSNNKRSGRKQNQKETVEYKDIARKCEKEDLEFEDLEFIFEINEKIEGFGNEDADPRILELQNSIEEDYFMELAKKKYDQPNFLWAKYKINSKKDEKAALVELGKEILLNMEFFRLVLQRLTEGQLSDIFCEINSFGKCSNEIASILMQKESISRGEGYNSNDREKGITFVYNYFEKFHNLSEEVMVELIEKSYPHFPREINFEKLDHKFTKKIAMAILDKDANIVFNNLDKFELLDHNELALKFLIINDRPSESYPHQGCLNQYYIAHFLDNLSNIDNKVAELLLSKGASLGDKFNDRVFNAMTRNIQSFRNVEHVQKMLDEYKSRYILDKK